MFRITALIAAASTLALAACGGSSYSSNSSSTKSTTTSASSGGGYGGGGYGSKPASTSSGSSGGGGSEVDMNDTFFQPKTITGKAGSTVKIELKNKGAAEHTFTVDSQKINEDLQPGKAATVSVKIPASGSVQFYCQFHKALGMTGTIKPA